MIPHSRRKTRRGGAGAAAVDRRAEPSPLGQRIAGVVTGAMGSWTFIVAQTVILILWIAANLLGATKRWDPYPFILLNLALSFQAAYAAPVIMMSQNRQQDIDRRAAESDYEVNVKAELEIALLHQKIDRLRAHEVRALTEAVRRLTDLMQRHAGEAPVDTTAGDAGRNPIHS